MHKIRCAINISLSEEFSENFREQYTPWQYVLSKVKINKLFNKCFNISAVGILDFVMNNGVNVLVYVVCGQ